MWLTVASDPPAVYSKTLDLYVVACNATTPTFSFDIAGRTFTIPRQDMFLPASQQGQCATSVTKGFSFGSEAYPDGFYVLGAAFLNSVVAVFDVGKGGMWFSPHKY